MRNNMITTLDNLFGELKTLENKFSCSSENLEKLHCLLGKISIERQSQSHLVKIGNIQEAYAKLENENKELHQNQCEMGNLILVQDKEIKVLQGEIDQLNIDKDSLQHQLQVKIERLNSDLKDKDTISAKQQAEIERLNDLLATNNVAEPEFHLLVKKESIIGKMQDEIKQLTSHLDKLAIFHRLDPNQFQILKELLAELNRAFEKHPDWPADPIHAAAILAEECGELVQAANDFFYQKHGTTKRMADEAVQCGAMAIRFLLNMDKVD